MLKRILLATAILLAAVNANATPNVASVQLGVTASGGGALTYQWYKNGVPVSGATSSTISVNSANADEYSVVVTDADGSTQTVDNTIIVHAPVAAPVVVTPPPVLAVGPRGPVGPQAGITCVGTAVPLTATIQTMVNNAPGGTTFCLAAGTYSKQHITPKSGDKFIGQIGTVLDGASVTNRAFASTSKTPNVTVSNMIVQNYIGGYQVPAIDGQNATGWVVTNTEVRTNDGSGVAFAGGALIQYNYIHHNLELGYGSNPGDGIQILDNEISFNNYTNKYDCGDECGGGKLWGTTNAKLSYNYTHDNHGPGMWDDFNNTGIEYSFNRVENNWSMGIFHEIGYAASIHDNSITGNGTSTARGPNCTWLWCAGILISASGSTPGSVEIYNNTITTPSSYGNAVALIQQNRTGQGTDQPSQGPWLVKNVHVHDNTFDLHNGGGIGGVTDFTAGNAMFVSGVNTFTNNHYILGSNTSHEFWWNGTQMNATLWKALGFDVNGTFN